jgi:hypothetical protein
VARILMNSPLWWRKCVGAKALAEMFGWMRNALRADAMRQAEESSGALAESQAFLSAGKRGLSGCECTKF